MSAMHWTGLSTDGRTFYAQRNEDGTTILYLPPKSRLGVGVFATISLADCEQGLYGPDGALIATCNDEQD